MFVELKNMIQQQNEQNTKILELLQQQNTISINIFGGITELKDIIINQNNVLSEVLSKQIVALNSSFKSHFEEPKFTTIFPLSSDDELNNFEKMINSENKSEIVSSVKRVLGTKGLQKGISNIFSKDIIINYNVRGIQGKKRLLDFKKVINILFLATSSEGGTEIEFYGELRKAFKAAKNKHFKFECLKRKKLDNETDSSN
ncbi:uncharacterized protein LOC119608032 isoform X2 [Lucilia sericata]|nr:uncharacterized protein LOC119608032 isoform X2 [Lucilia sericata]